MSPGLYSLDHPARFWRLLPPDQPSPGQWEAAAARAARVLPPAARADTIDALLERTLGEGQFGPDHWHLSWPRRCYYVVKPLLPRALTRRLRRAHGSIAVRGAGLDWPIEDRYRLFVWRTVQQALREAGSREARFVAFWPGGASHALVLTHDVETGAGQAAVPQIADLEQRLGLRSSFNFVAERYRLDRGLLDELATRGFEIGIHGLWHDGRGFRSRREFERRARRINEYVAELGVAGFRSPLTHRHPEWMQALSVEYDASFFDTDPMEPIPGGTMSLWPFLLGRFVELPYTLPQDYTLTDVLGEGTPDLWLAKLAYLRRWYGMALLNTHPDYLRQPRCGDVYRRFLELALERGDAWRALPREVARWWRRRVTMPPEELPEAAIGRLLISGDEIEIDVPGRSRAPLI